MVDVPVDHPSHDNLAQQAAEERLRGCHDAMWHHDEHGLDAEEHECEEGCPGDPSSAPFCGCDTCIVREVLDAAARFMVTQVTLDLKDIKPDSVCVIHTEDPLPACITDILSETLSSVVKPRSLLIFGPDITLDTVDEDEMRAAGWVRA